jgi:hypothetical protein
MKQSTFLFCILLSFLTITTKAAVPTDETEKLVDRINQSVPGKGSVTVIQDDKISERLGKPGKRAQSNDEDVFTEINGYRIQVFVGNNQRVSKNEAYSKETDIKSIFPELSTYVGFTAPFWRLKVGDFQSFQDAQKILTQLKAKFPDYGREMSVVKDKVRIKKSTKND